MDLEIEYCGFEPNKNWKPSVIAIDIDPQLFFEKYVKTRTPVIIDGIFPELNRIPFWITNKYSNLIEESWSITNLKDIAKSQSSLVEVEKRDKQGAFGKGIRVSI
jgi:hypothetical protein